MNNQSLKKAIETSDYFSMSESLVLLELLATEKNKTSNLDIKNLVTKLDLSHTSIYNAINKLKAKGFILKVNTSRNTYVIKKDKLIYIHKLSKES